MCLFDGAHGETVQIDARHYCCCCCRCNRTKRKVAKKTKVSPTYVPVAYSLHMYMLSISLISWIGAFSPPPNNSIGSYSGPCLFVIHVAAVLPGCFVSQNRGQAQGRCRGDQVCGGRSSCCFGRRFEGAAAEKFPVGLAHGWVEVDAVVIVARTERYLEYRLYINTVICDNIISSIRRLCIFLMVYCNY